MEAAQDVSLRPLKWTAYKKYVVGILLVVYTFNFIDRQIIAILAPAIQADLNLSDTQLGMLKGVFFALFYAGFGIPIARLADKRSRVNIIVGALTTWSAMTAVCGLAGNFWQLALARVGVGVGEAGCTPPAHSLLSDYFAQEQRSTAIGIYSLGVPIGTVFGFLLGGLIVETLGWRWGFVVVGLPGILIALLVKFTLREPMRGQSDDRPIDMSKDAQDSTETFLDNLKPLWSIKSFRILTYSASLSTFCGYAMSMWIVELLVRAYGFGIGEISLPLATVLGIGGGVGTVFGGMITDRLSKKDVRAVFSFPSIVHFLAMPFLACAIWAPSGTLAFVALLPFYLLTMCITGPFYGLVQNLSPAKSRAFASAFFLLALNAFGFGLGPIFVGVLSDMLSPSVGPAQAVQWSLTALIPLYAIAAFIALTGRRYIRRDLQTVAAAQE